MQFIKENIFYVEFSKKYNMYLIKNKVLKAAINMGVIENIIENTNQDINIFLEKVGSLDSESMAILIIESIKYFDPKITESEIIKYFDFDFAIEFLNKLFKKSMPTKEKIEDSIFEDEEEIKTQKWDLEHMEYIWYTVLNRKDDFKNITPKKYFNQITTHLNINKKDNTQDIKDI